MKQLYIIEYENAHWCGGQLNCVVWADDATEAEMLASDWMEECQRELFSDSYADEKEDYDDGSAVTVNHIQLLAGSKFEKHYNDPTQSEFYPCVN